MIDSSSGSSNEIQSGLLVPVPEAEPVVGEWRRRRTLDGQKGVPPHITVLAPFIPPGKLTPSMERRLGELFAGIPAFEFHLARVSRWPLVVYLAPEPEDRFRALTEAVVDAFPGYPPYGGVFEDVIPHLTVAECETGLCDDADSVLGEVERAVAGVVPIEANAREVWLMEGNGRWSVRGRFALGPSARPIPPQGQQTGPASHPF